VSEHHAHVNNTVWQPKMRQYRSNKLCIANADDILDAFLDFVLLSTLFQQKRVQSQPAAQLTRLHLTIHFRDSPPTWGPASPPSLPVARGTVRNDRTIGRRNYLHPFTAELDIVLHTKKTSLQTITNAPLGKRSHLSQHHSKSRHCTFTRHLYLSQPPPWLSSLLTQTPPTQRRTMRRRIFTLLHTPTPTCLSRRFTRTLSTTRNRLCWRTYALP
jgi:hypothetical protein